MPEDSQAQQNTLVGTTVGNYRIVERLAAGGMGEVYVAEHVRIFRRVAVKFLLPELSDNREVVDRLFAEARSTSSIRHPGIVEIFDCDVDADGRAYIVMELLAGESLTARLERDASFGSDIDRPLAVAEQMASALSAAHANGIIHRDLKPDNVVLIDGEGDSRSRPFVKILDFGIAKLLVRNEAMRTGRISITIPGTVLGTPRYMSPEQCRDASNVDHRTDVYSLGCILFEMLCGRPPFVAESFAELVAAQLQQEPPLVGSLRKRTPVRIQAGEAHARQVARESPGDHGRGAGRDRHASCRPSETSASACRRRSSSATTKVVPTRRGVGLARDTGGGGRIDDRGRTSRQAPTFRSVGIILVELESATVAGGGPAARPAADCDP
jgi:serine/threonine protein kinase